MSYLDQWAYLASVRKMSTDEIERLHNELCEGNGLGDLWSLENEDKNTSKTWESKTENPTLNLQIPLLLITSKPWENKSADNNLNKNDFPGNLTITEANRLYISKKGVSPHALNRIKRLAAFQNPQFYKTQKMRMSTYGIPRIIHSFDETDEYIGIPRK